MEKAAIKSVWGDEVGKTKIKKLHEPVLTEAPRGDGRGTTGLYCRGYNKDMKEHQHCLLLYDPGDLPKGKLLTAT